MTEPVAELLEKAVRASRERQRPSARNLQIADEVRVVGRTQAEVAAQFGISQRRVSQICQQVDRWFSSPGWWRGDQCEKEQERAEEELSRRQLAEVYRRAMRAYMGSERALVTRKSGLRKAGEPWSETCEREQRLDTGSLRVALRAIEQQNRMKQRPVPTYGNEERGQVQYLQWAMECLAQLRYVAEQSGAVQRGPVDSRRMVEEMLRTLLGGQAPAEASRTPAATAGWASSGTLRPAAASSSTEEVGLEEPATEAVEPEALPASPMAETSCDAGQVCEAQEQDAGISASRRALQQGAATAGDPSVPSNPSNPSVDLQLQQAQTRIEYCCGMAMSDERIAEQLALLSRWERGRFTTHQQNRNLREALAEYRRLKERTGPKARHAADCGRN